MNKKTLTAARHAIVKALVAGFALAGTTHVVHAAIPDFTYTGAAATFVVPTTGQYDIVAFGAQGGASGGTAGGRGAKVGSIFSLTAGHSLNIYVGGQGGSAGGDYGGGGGGGSFIYNATTSSLLLVAGGGGGSYGGTAGGMGRAQLVVQGTGFGGAGDADPGGGGGGFHSSGNSFAGGGGFPSLGGGIKGYGGAAFGGFGGGGGGGGYGGGGGGGYTGGDGGRPSRGGSSFIKGIETVRIDGDQAGNGLVQISAIPAVPEPASWALMGLGVAGLAARRKWLSANSTASATDADSGAGSAAGTGPSSPVDKGEPASR